MNETGNAARRMLDANMKRKAGREEKDMLRIRGERIPLLKFPMLEACDLIEHGITTRLGGVSEGMLASLNLSFSRGDEKERVQENFRRVSGEFGASEDRFVFTEQEHADKVRVVREEDAGKGLTCERDYSCVDALVTNVPRLVLSVFVADCVPVFFVDPVRRAIGLAHSGWKGTAGRIAEKTLRLMSEQYGTRAEDVLCGIAPSICQSCFEIRRDVAGVFAKEFAGQEEKVMCLPGAKDASSADDADVAALKERLRGDDPEDKFHLDLWAANRLILEDAGVLPENISVTDVCTCCNTELLFSHRGSNGRRGNLGAFLMIKD